MIIVAGTVRVRADQLAALRPHAAAVIEATRAEAGCQIYSFADDLTDPGLIRIFEVWATRADLDAHGRAAHLLPWRAALADFGAIGRDVRVYDASGGEPL